VESGFTLVELLIVIVILGVLAGIVVFGVATFRGDSELAACKADLKTTQTASDAYYAGKGSYAASIPALVTAKYLKAAPPAASQLTYDNTTGAVTSGLGGCTV
jgi:general secretion pathway protein G